MAKGRRGKTGQFVRFDDSLKTVLAADSSTAFGAQATFRQLTDLIARGRVQPDTETIGRLRALRGHVPAAVRAASARSLALGHPPVELVSFFAGDTPEIASAALRAARLSASEWMTMVPQLGPVGRAVLRRRDDLAPDVVRALEAFGSTDFVLGYDGAPFTAAGELSAAPADVSPADDDVVAELSVIVSSDAPQPAAPDLAPAPQPRDTGGFEIGELVDRIASFQRARGPAAPPPRLRVVDTFRFETGADGTVTWTDAMPRGALIGLSLTAPASGTAQVDDVVSSAIRTRTSFTDARLTLDGAAALAGEWRLSATPLFDAATARFCGYRGSARRPRRDERAPRSVEEGNAEGLRRLVHELRTPTNAIAGFSELIEAQLLGPVAPVYRERAAAIRSLAADLIAAIEDLDLAARIEGDALQLRPAVMALAPVLGRIAEEVRSLATMRGCTLTIAPMDAALAVGSDDRALERLFGRLIGTIVSAAQPGETITVTAGSSGLDTALVSIALPRALADLTEEELFALDAEREAELPGAPLLGTGFALRLVRNLSASLGGQMLIMPGRVVVSLPATVAETLGQAATSGG